MNINYDIAIIGGGILGCFTARNLARYNWRVAVFEKNCDVCTEVSKANTAIIYPGYDPQPGSIKAKLNLKAVKNFNKLCEDLGVNYKQPGSLMVSCGEIGDKVVKKKYEQGVLNGLTDLRLLSAAETLALEPGLNRAVSTSLFSPFTATLNPWELGIAGAMNASENNVDFYFNCEVHAIGKTGVQLDRNSNIITDAAYQLEAGEYSVSARAVVNCSGLYGDTISEIINSPYFKIDPSTADYLLLDESANEYVNHIIMYESEEKGNKLSIVPTVDGNVLLGPSRIKTKTIEAFDTTREGCDFIKKASAYVMPGLPLDTLIRSFASLRPKISLVAPDENGEYYLTGEKIHDILIYETENPGFINLAGIRTPGLTCCDEIGEYVTDMLLDILGSPGRKQDFRETLEKNERFANLTFEEQGELIRANREYGKIVCRCKHVTEAEIRRCIRQTLGATTLDGVKRRVGAQMGRCQGGFCTQRIIEILAEEQGLDIAKIQKDGIGSELLGIRD